MSAADVSTEAPEGRGLKARLNLGFLDDAIGYGGSLLSFELDGGQGLRFIVRSDQLLRIATDENVVRLGFGFQANTR